MQDPRWEVPAEAFGVKWGDLVLVVVGGSRETDRSAVGGGYCVGKGPAIQSPSRDRSVGG